MPIPRPEVNVPDDASPELLKLRDELVDAMMKNANKSVFIAENYNRMLDPQAIKEKYIEHLFNVLIPVGSEQRLRVELEWQSTIEESLRDLEKACKQNKFAGDKLWTPGMNGQAPQ